MTNDLAPNTTLAHYRIVSKIGAGGMGEVYLAIRELLRLKPDFSTTVHDTFAKWFDPELSGQLIDGLRKAGLEIVDEQPGVHYSSGP